MRYPTTTLYQQLETRDCFRCCLASILGKDPSLIPHFFTEDVDGPTMGQVNRLLDEWLKGLGLGLLTHFIRIDDFDPLLGDYTPAAMRSAYKARVMESHSGNVHFILTGQVNGCIGEHAVVGFGDEILFDPSPLATDEYRMTFPAYGANLGCYYYVIQYIFPLADPDNYL